MFYIAVGLKPYHHIEIYDIRKYLSEKIIVSWNLEYKFKDGFVTPEQVEILKNELLKNDLKIIRT